jgi:DNA-binding response OmpR family regulator
MAIDIILLVEDNEPLREITAELIRGYGYGVVTAATAFEAIRIAKFHEVDAALIDLGLPDMDGRDLAKVLKHLPLAILSGDASEACVPEAKVILQKPLAPGELISALRILLPESWELGLARA